MHFLKLQSIISIITEELNELKSYLETNLIHYFFQAKSLHLHLLKNMYLVFLKEKKYSLNIKLNFQGLKILLKN